MHRAWLLCLLGCSYPPLGVAAPGDAAQGSQFDSAVDAEPDATLAPICASIALGAPQFVAAACATLAAAPLKISTSTLVDTDRASSSPSGLECQRVPNGSAQLCVLAAPSIVIDPGVVLAAHGSTPFALFAHAITIRGTLDVASHVRGTAGAGAQLSGCIAGAFPSHAGGGHGGADSGAGGAGGDEGNAPGSGGHGSFSVGTVSVRGGCGGTRGGDGTVPTNNDSGLTTGGAGGGAVWIVSDTDGLTLDAGAAINASGASGLGGTAAVPGGAGGGAGGVIVLQSSAIHLDPGAAIFANGGAGGGGAGANPATPGFTGGTDGADPTGPSAGGVGGASGLDGAGHVAGAALGGEGGPGFPSDLRDGNAGGTDGHGGGGGGGGAGAILVVSSTRIAGANVSPTPVNLQ